MSQDKTGVQKAIDAAGTGEKLAEVLDVTPMAISKFKRQGYFPLPRAKMLSEMYTIPLRELVSPELREIMENQ